MTINPRMAHLSTDQRALWLLVFTMFTLSGCTGWNPLQSEENASENVVATQERRSTQRPYKAFGITYTPLLSAKGYRAEGIASWYGKAFHGRPTANGELYDMRKPSAAHTVLPLPTWVRVTNLENGRTLVIRVNDRGPFVKDRLIDLSYEAAKRLDYLKKGTARVRVEALPKNDPAIPKNYRVIRYDPSMGPVKPVTMKDGAPDSTIQTKRAAPVAAARAPDTDSGLFVQVGAFSRLTNARRLALKLQSVGPSHIQQVDVDGTPFYRVRLGPFSSTQEAGTILESLANLGFGGRQVVTK
ncbi:MAG: septal ring lytic transglycosylase RlpA family protein [Magnetococcales bacterium]|nr:septal ring lytic transglycosylase RlpA family protein [Magnetococcales bacterium]